ncbi:MAG: DUF998 domain-containing protein [Acholeplasmataceae bacterium]|nr:DUF998 domain-containing protein [Acholeplasmataceae bacterium]
MIIKKKKKMLLLVLAITAILSYFTHVWLGTILYEGYNPLTQAISDLTADDSPVKNITRIFSNLYGLLSVIVVIGFIVYKKEFKRRIVRLGILLFSLMMIISAVGYALFPLSESGLANSFQDIMHMVVTIAVVSLTIVSLILLAIGFRNVLYRSITITAFLLLLLSSLAMPLVGPNYFGLMERINVYTVILYFGFLAILIFFVKEKSLI